MTIYLYVKTHNKTGLKYLGKTTNKNPHTYPGSGKYWKLHLGIHGCNYSTEILRECQTKEEIAHWGKYYSELWNVANDPGWANLKPEEGDGGAQVWSNESKLKVSKKLKGRIISEEHRAKISTANKGKKDTRTPEVKLLAAKKASAKLKGKKKPQGFAEAVSKRMRGSKRNNTTKQKMKDAWSDERKQQQSERTRLQNLNRPVITCPHCGKQSRSPIIKKYHFDNCKMCLHDPLNRNPEQVHV